MGRRFHYARQCCSNTTTKHQKLPTGLTDPTMDEFVTAMSSFAVPDATRSAVFVCEQKRSVGFTMMLWQM